jgi:hypothetical protein
VKQTPGSIGYVELAYAYQSRLPVAAFPAWRPLPPHLEPLGSVPTAPVVQGVDEGPDSAELPIAPAVKFGAPPQIRRKIPTNLRRKYDQQ